jgi:hypothetical protein
MRRLWFSLAWVAWLMMATVIVIVIDGLVSPSDAPPQSTIVQLLGGYDGQHMALNGDASMLAWACERILPAHLLAYLAWRLLKAIFWR